MKVYLINKDLIPKLIAAGQGKFEPVYDADGNAIASIETYNRLPELQSFLDECTLIDFKPKEK